MPTDIVEFLKAKLKKEIDTSLHVDSIDHRVDLIRTDLEIGQSVFDYVGSPALRAPITKITNSNCGDEPVVQAIPISLTETQTCTWTFTSDVSLTREMSVTVTGTVTTGGPGPGGSLTAGATDKVGVTLKIGQQAAGTRTQTVTLGETVTITIRPRRQCVVKGFVWTTPITGHVDGNIVARFWHGYTLPFTFAPNQQIVRVQRIMRIPFRATFDTELITFTKEINCDDAKCSHAGMVATDDGSDVGYALFGESLKPPTTTAFMEEEESDASKDEPPIG